MNSGDTCLFISKKIATAENELELLVVVLVPKMLVLWHD